MIEKIRSLFSNRRTLLLIIILLSIFFGFINLGAKPLERWDEETNARVVHSIINEGRFELDGKVFTEKPPLWYYLTAFIVRVFGENNYNLRIVSAVSLVLINILIFIVCEKKYSKWVAFLSAISLVAARQFIGVGLNIFSTHSVRSADLDLLQILFILVSFYTLYNKTRYRIFLTSLFSALAILTKGPLGILIPILYLVYALIRKENVSEAIKIIILSFLMILPWHIAMILYYPDEFLTSYINYHLFSRTLMPIENHSGSILFYIELILNPFIFFAGIIFLNIKKIFKDINKDIFEFIIILFPLSIIVIFTIVQTKLAWYILPIYPFIIILMAKLIYEKKIIFNLFTNLIYVLLSIFIIKKPIDIIIIFGVIVLVFCMKLKKTHVGIAILLLINILLSLSFIFLNI